MQEEREISLVSIFFTILKKRKLLFVLFVVFAVAGYGFFVYRANMSVPKDDSAESVAEAVTEEDIRQAKENTEVKKKYVENAAYMELDAAESHVLTINYLIDWKDKSISGDAYENKSATLHGMLAAYYPSEDFIERIEGIKGAYKGKFYDRLIWWGRSGNTITFSILYSGNKYIGDLKDIIKTTLKEKEEEFKPYLGDFEFVFVQEIDKEANASDIKNEQKAQKDELKTLSADAKKLKVTTKSESTERVIWIGFKNSIICVFLGLFVACAVGFLMAIFGKKVNFVDDITDVPGREVICVFKKEPESGLDRMYYRKNDRYQHPERYLSILEKNMEDAGLKMLYLYNCSDADLSYVTEKIAGAMGSIRIRTVAEDDKDSFYLNVKEDEAVVILAKGGDTRRDALSRIEEHLRAVGVKCLGEIFVV